MGPSYSTAHVGEAPYLEVDSALNLFTYGPLGIRTAQVRELLSRWYVGCASKYQLCSEDSKVTLYQPSRTLGLEEEAAKMLSSLTLRNYVSTSDAVLSNSQIEGSTWFHQTLDCLVASEY